VLIDALRYDFTVPRPENSTDGPVLACHNALPFLYETAVREPKNAFLLPFIADPPTTTLQRLKGLTTGTLPTFIDAGSNFAGTAIEEDNLLIQLRDAKQRIVHLGDDTWTALFPGYFEENLSHAYDSFNVWDLHTVDEGVIEHIFPLLQAERKGEWDVMIGHFLGVDHAGHRYGPDHPAMTAKLAQMNKVVRDLVASVDDDTLLVVMGDHGMDSKGDHGGESDDEVQAALWMYSRKGIFGRETKELALPPRTPKERWVNQIDLVPTLALLLGLPIPYNNLGKPIQEAFGGRKGNDWKNLAGVGKMTSAAVKRYLGAYYQARGMEEATGEGSPGGLWKEAEKAYAGATGKAVDEKLEKTYKTLVAFQEETLRICRDLWARFDIPSMVQGILILATGLLVLVVYARNVAEDDGAVTDEELEKAERQLELEGIAMPEAEEDDVNDFTKSTVTGAYIGLLGGGCLGITASFMAADTSSINEALLGAAGGSLLGALAAQMGSTIPFRVPLPTNIWSFLSLLFAVLPAVGFASNSFTIWEDSILLYFLSTFGVVAAMASLRRPTPIERTMGLYHSILFVVVGWMASSSTLCREEQMPWCRSSYYASATSSTSAPWQLLIPYVVAALLPSIIKSYYESTRSYYGFAPLWIGVVFRGALAMTAVFWTLDAADDSGWFPSLEELSPGVLKDLRVQLAKTVIAICVAGIIAWSWAPPCVDVQTSTASTESPTTTTTTTDASGLATTTVSGKPKAKTTITILGHANVHGTRYFLFFTLPLLLMFQVTKPMGFLSVFALTLQLLSLFELVDLLNLRENPIGPTILALLGGYHFFKTGHQATLSSIQWESAFVPLHTIMYPWSPLLVGINMFGSFMLTTLAVPLIVLWKCDARVDAHLVVRRIGRALGWYVAVVAGWALVTSVYAGWLRRHLMLFRIFSPRWMVGSAVVGVVDFCVLGVALVCWFNGGSLGGMFGWA
jgi:phosphatidylinositol glycan class O